MPTRSQSLEKTGAPPDPGSVGTLSSISDHWPVLVRLSLNDTVPAGPGGNAALGAMRYGPSPALQELRERLDKKGPRT